MKQTVFDYFYGQEAESFSFYRIPKVLFTDERFAGLTCEAKVLYGLMLDRMSLSVRNGWLDDDGKVCVSEIIWKSFSAAWSSITFSQLFLSCVHKRRCNQLAASCFPYRHPVRNQSDVHVRCSIRSWLSGDCTDPFL